MKPSIKISRLTHAGFALFSLALSPVMQGANPPPDGGYPGGNTAEGQSALLSLTTGTYNTAVGIFALLSDTEGKFNTALGAATLLANTGDQNTATGAGALLSNTTGNSNTADGAFALFSNIDGSENSSFGWSALTSNTSGFGNTAVGANALRNNTEGGTNTATGVQALFTNTTGQDNTASGYQALFFNDGDPTNNEGTANSAFGAYALGSNTTGALNSAFGWSALGFNTTGSINTALGDVALYNNIDGNDNVAIGDSALYHNSSGGGNVAVGGGALFSNTTGVGNTGVGAGAFGSVSTGIYNTAVGYTSGSNVTTANNVICIGSAGDNVDSSCFIGNIYSNIQPVIGTDPDYVTIASNGRLGRSNFNGSSRRFKHDIQPMGKASEVIFALRPVSFRYNKEYDPAERPSFGLIAEDVASVAPDLVGRNKKGEPESVRYEQINAMLFNEFLKEHKKVQQLEVAVVEQHNHFEATISELRKQIEHVAACSRGQEIQNVNAQVQANGSAPQTVTNKEQATAAALVERRAEISDLGYNRFPQVGGLATYRARP